MRPERSEQEKLLDKVVLIDSNVFLEVELAESHADACKQFLRKVRDGSIKSAITDFHVDSIVYGELWKELEGYSHVPSIASPL